MKKNMPYETEFFWDSEIPLTKDPLPYESCFSERDNSQGGRAMSFDAGRTAISLISRYNFICFRDTMELWVKNRYTGNFHDYGELVVEIELSRFAEAHRGEFSLRSEIITNVKREVKNRSIINRKGIAEIKYPEWVNLENCKINLFTGKATLHDLTRVDFKTLHNHMDEEEEALEWKKYTEDDEKYLFLTKLPIDYKPNKECPEFDAFLERILPDENDRLTVFEWFGYCLFNTYDIQKVWLLLGKGANGKSTLLKVLEVFLGDDNTSCEDIFNLSDNRFATAQLFNKKANIVYEMESQYLERTSILKSLTGGDTIRGEKKNQNPFSFTNYAKIILSMNQAFQIKAEALNFAFARRFNVMKFKVRIPENERADQDKLVRKLTTKDEISGIFNKAIQGLLRLYGTKKFSNAQPESELLAEWVKLSAPARWFWEEVLSLGSENDQGIDYKHSDLFGTCELIVNREGLPEVSETAFSRMATKAKVPSFRKQVNGVRDKYYKNLHFNNGYKRFLLEVQGNQPQPTTGGLTNFVEPNSQPQSDNLIGRIKAYIRNEGGEASGNMIISQFEDNNSREEIDAAIQSLSREGEIYNPRPNWYRLGE
jgi:P4 family phage/plasmid primase-like protien